MELQLMTIEPLVSSGPLRQLLKKSTDFRVRKGIVQRFAVYSLHEENLTLDRLSL